MPIISRPSPVFLLLSVSVSRVSRSVGQSVSRSVSRSIRKAVHHHVNVLPCSSHHTVSYVSYVSASQWFPFSCLPCFLPTPHPHPVRVINPSILPSFHPHPHIISRSRLASFLRADVSTAGMSGPSASAKRQCPLHHALLRAACGVAACGLPPAYR